VCKLQQRVGFNCGPEAGTGESEKRNYLRGFLEKKQSLQNAKQSLENSTAELGGEITNFLAHGTV